MEVPIAESPKKSKPRESVVQEIKVKPQQAKEPEPQTIRMLQSY